MEDSRVQTDILATPSGRSSEDEEACSHQGVLRQSELPCVLSALLRLGGVAVAVWGLCYALWACFPEMTPGSVRVYDAKLARLTKPGMFSPGAKEQVLAIGHSYTMSGFRPAEFDALSAGQCSSFNLGLPVTVFGRRLYTLSETLSQLRSSGNAPSVILITWREPWPPVPVKENQSVWRRLTPKFDSSQVMQKVFPFKQLGRDGLIFLVRSLRHGGPRAYRKACNEEVASMLSNQGYYFIKTDSIYPNNRLPEDYSLRSDSPTVVLARDSAVWEAFAQELRSAASGVRIFLVPNYYREKSCAPAPPNDHLRALLGPYGIEVVGPDYFRYPNRLFSDSAHLNPVGAEIYTRDLWALVSQQLGR